MIEFVRSVLVGLTKDWGGDEDSAALGYGLVDSPAALNVQTDGGVVYNFPSHAFTVTLEDPAIVVSGTTKQIVADANHARTRPLCEYPGWPRYRSGDPDSASSFACTH